jgi:hypothetical protein
MTANADEPFLRLRTFSACQTVAIEATALVPFASAEAIDGIEALGDSEVGDEGTFLVLALTPLSALLDNSSGLNRHQIRAMKGDGPLVFDEEHERGRWKARVVVMRCGEETWV